jgi:uncharacterized DUF497 family protein
MEFDWDPEKNRRNQDKHGIPFHEAATAFDDELQLTIADPDHSFGEHRYLTIGMTVRGRLVVVSHTEDDDDEVRIINARHPTATERRIYEEGK